MEQPSPANKYAHIKGWGIDADPKNEPTYPMKHYTGDDHNRLNYERAALQPVTVEVLHSNERPNITAVFGTSAPLSGLSGKLRRFAFTYSENRLRHWFPLVLADRINVIEGVLDDLRHRHIPNLYAECGWEAEWKHNRKSAVTKLVVGAAVASFVSVLLYRRMAQNARK
jgi:hypothetical protein